MNKLFWFLSLFGIAYGQPGSALWEYVHRDDGMYEYTEIDTIVQNGITSYVINMTSQQWIDGSYTNKPIHYHYVTIHVPDVLSPDFLNHGFIYVGTGSWDDNPPDAGSRHVEETGNYANKTGMVTAVIKQVPFQPIIFEGTAVERSEDGIIAYTWAEFLESGGTTNPEQLARFPMCKAVHKAMDAMAAVAADKTGGVSDIRSYMVAGESKRGWTTWMMPAADDRIVAIAPVVLSCLNLNDNFHHYYRSMGGWPFAFTNYYAENITVWVDHPTMFELMEYIDPFSYKDTMTMPKLMVSGSSDEFFMVDDYDYFFADLPGEKHIMILENTGHSINDSPVKDEYWTMLETFYIAVIKNRPRPAAQWERFVESSTGAGYIQVTLDQPADSVVAWSADTPDMVAPRRDFRNLMRGGNGTGEVETGVTWFEFPASNVGGLVWRIEFDKPESGYRAFYFKMVFPYPEEARTFAFTSEVLILSFDPDNEFPFEDCYGVACQGTLV